MDYSIGSVVRYKPFGGGTRTVKVYGKGENNGRACFDGIALDAKGHTVFQEDHFTPVTVWGYDFQIVSVG